MPARYCAISWAARVFSSPRTLLARATRYGTEINSIDWLKFVALVVMTMDHVGAYLVADPGWWKAIGRVTVPAWFFLAGYAQSRQMSGEILWLSAVLVLCNYAVGAGVFPLNALASIVICRYVVFWLHDRGHMDRRIWDVFLACGLLAIPSVLLFEYGTLGICFAVMGHQVRQAKRGVPLAVFTALSTLLFIAFQCAIYDFGIWQNSVMMLGTVITVLYLYRFRMQKSRVAPQSGWANYAVRLIARNTMHYYALHRMIFQIVGVLLGLSAFDPWRIFTY
jgi:hypothetical protein